MNTYSHFLLTALGGDQLKRRRSVPMKALLLGSVMPDVPLLLLTLGYFAYRHWIDPWQPGEFIFGPRYDNLYFQNWAWITSHNLFHAPFIIAALAALGYYGLQRDKKWGAPLFWFAVACGFHTLIDILTHRNDGPLLFFPFNWEIRFTAPVSYWDPRHHGRIFGLFEHALDAGILLYLGGVWLYRRWGRVDRAASEAGGE